MVRKILLGLVALGAVVLIFIGIAARQAYRFWIATPESLDTAEIIVEEGETLSEVVPELADAGLVNPFWFKVYAKLFGGSYIQAGEYQVTYGTSYAAILDTLQHATVGEVFVTFPEGFTIAQMGERVVASFPEITQEEWAKMTGQFSPLESHAFIVAAEKPDGVDLEGYLFPDTYQFFEDATAEQIVTIMIDTMAERVRTVGLAEHLSDEIPTLHDALTLASIVEKEVRQPETMANVADIFLKRLAIGMALQSDATINYVTGGDDPSVSLADLEIESEYNTYKYPGLPPGPISNPGLNALAAVATPAQNNYYYFLTTDDGEVYYATTHDEHVANKARYLR
ncbi:endolytic transglycosylase MltG [Candidatus Uhrbacteria bacterium]|nr:endolytic transglycosylase MltG [Candidatus Uhrbacteria bacterium]